MTRAATGRVIVGVLWLTIVIVVASAWSAGASRPRVHAAPASTGTTPVLDDTTNSDAFAAPAAAEPRFDLYGNEIDNAIGDYRVDFRGDIYERHSPDTEVTELAAPSL
jgi:hypothetical protein